MLPTTFKVKNMFPMGSILFTVIVATVKMWKHTLPFKSCFGDTDTKILKVCSHGLLNV